MFGHANNDGRVRTFLLGVYDPIAQGGELAVGREYYFDAGFQHYDLDKSEIYNRGANVGEWLWDLFHLQNVRRLPWVCRS
jgi:hypothetical protein